MMRRERGSASGEQLILAALAALFIGGTVALWFHSPAHAYTLIALAVTAAVLAFTTGILRDRRNERMRAERCRLELARAAAAKQAAIEATFTGKGQAGHAAFGVASAAGKLFYAREGHPFRVETLEFTEIRAAFARADGDRFRLEVRAEKAAEPLYLTVAQRGEAERWVATLAPHLGARARMVDAAASA
jgi:hypothetical protein